MGLFILSECYSSQTLAHARLRLVVAACLEWLVDVVGALHHRVEALSLDHACMYAYDTRSIRRKTQKNEHQRNERGGIMSEEWGALKKIRWKWCNE